MTAGTGRLAGPTDFLTGSGQNIGQAIAQLFAGGGASVIVNGHRDAEKVQAVVEEIQSLGGAAFGVLADVSNPDQGLSLVNQWTERVGGLDIAVKNAGRRWRQPFEDISLEDWTSTINHKLNSVLSIAHEVLPAMPHRAWGRVINISGYDGVTGHMADRAHPVTAKAGMHGLTKAIAREYGVYGVTCNTVVPGAIATAGDMTKTAHLDPDAALGARAIRHAGDPEDIAEACLYLAGASGKLVTGPSLHVNGGEFMF